MDIAIIGSGPAGLFLGAALARRGHRVTGIDRDPGPATGAPWPRRGVMQFQHAHGFRSAVAATLATEIPEAVEAWESRGAEPVNMDIPGLGRIPGGHRSTRETFERALRESAGAVPGFTLRHGHVDSVVAEGGRAAAVVVEGVRLDADLVIDASGRNGRATRSLGERVTVGGPCGMAYVDRVYELLPGAEPGPMINELAWQADFDGYQAILFRHERGLFSVLLVRPADDPGLRDLRHPAAFEAACRAIPGLDVWTAADRSQPVTPVLPGGPLLNVYRSQTTADGYLVLPGVFFVGDSVATTTPIYGRGITTTLWQAAQLLTLLDEEADLISTGLAFDTWCGERMRPWVVDHIEQDTARTARWGGADVDTSVPLPSDLILAAGQVRPEIMAAAPGYFMMTELPEVLGAVEPIAHEVYDGGWRPPYAPGPSRAELVEIVRAHEPTEAQPA